VSIKKIAGSFVVYAEASFYNIIQQLTASKKTRMSAGFMLVF
jgi:hypothetical protein